VRLLAARPRDERACALALPRARFPFADISIEKDIKKAKRMKKMNAERVPLGERLLFISNSS
jgi:hypothetical protein